MSEVAELIEKYEAIVKKDPDNSDAWGHLSSLYPIAGKFKMTRIAFERFKLLTPCTSISFGSYATDPEVKEILRNTADCILIKDLVQEDIKPDLECASSMSLDQILKKQHKTRYMD